MTTATSNGSTYSFADVNAASEFIFTLMLGQGQMSRDEIRKACADHHIDTDLYGKAFARLGNQVKVLTEITRDDGKKAYELKRHAAQLGSYGDFLALMEETQAPTKPREKYDAWYTLTGTFVLRSPALASRPVVGSQSRREFLRDHEGALILPSGNYAAMWEAACGKPGTPEVGGARYRVEWDHQTLPAALLSLQLCPVPPSRPGGSGQGVTEVESLPAGTALPWSATIPGSHCTPLQFAQVLVAAGRWCGFSPSAAHLGWGRFTPTFNENLREEVTEA